MHELKLLIPLNFDSVATTSTACVSLGVYRLFLEFLTEINTTEISPRCTRRQLKKLQLSDTIGPTGLLYEYCSY